MNKNMKNANNSKDDDYAFVMHLCMWIMELVTTRHMTSHIVVFNTYEIIILVNVHSDNDNNMEAIKIRSIINDM